MTREFRVRIPAKINLSLAITGKRDNLHTLDMIVYPCDKLADEIVFFPEDCKGLSFLKMRGYDGFDKDRFSRENRDKLDGILKHFGIGGGIEIVKNIPLGAGLGGSSAVYAGVVKSAMEYLKSTGENMPLDTAFLLSLGSDVPCVFLAKACRVSGVGEKISVLDDVPKLDFEILVASGGADSGKCYKIYDEICKINTTAPPCNIQDALNECRNDLFEASIKVNPNIKIAYDELKNKGYSKVIMTGSGSAVVGIVE